MEPDQHNQHGEQSIEQHQRHDRRIKLKALRGFTLVEALVALGIASILLGVALAIMGATGRAFPVESGRVAGEMQLDQLVTQLNESAHSSVSIYTPNNACGASPGDGTPCASVRFYGLDSSGRQHFWGWTYNAVTKTVTQCLSYPTSEGACAATGGNITGVLAFTATPLTAPTVGARYGLAGVRNVEKLMLGADNRVVAGNRLMIVHVANSYVQRETHLLQSGAPYSANVLQGSYTPPPLSSTSLSAVPNPMWFANTTAAATTVNARETNYSQYEPYLAQPWWNNNAASCVTATWNTNTTPSDATTYHVQPTGIGQCQFTISSHDQQSNGMQAYVAGPLTAFWNGSAQADNANVSLNFAQTASIGGGKTWDANENGNLNAIGFGSCPVLSLGGISYNWGGQPTAGYGEKDQAVTASAVGTCSLSISDTVGDVTQLLNVKVNGTLTVNPSVVHIYAPGGPDVPTSASISLSEPGYSGAFSVANNGCGGNVTVGAFSSSGPNATVTVRSVAAVSACVITFQDQYGTTGSLTVAVDPQPTPTPTPTPPALACGTPSPNTLPHPSQGRAVDVNSFKANANSGLTGRDGKPLISDGAEMYGYISLNGSEVISYYLTENNDGTITFVSDNTTGFTPNASIGSTFGFNMPGGTALSNEAESYTYQGTCCSGTPYGTIAQESDPRARSTQVIAFINDSGGTGPGPNGYSIPGKGQWGWPSMDYLQLANDHNESFLLNPAGFNWSCCYSGSFGYYAEANALWVTDPTHGPTWAQRSVWEPLAANGTVIPVPWYNEWLNIAANSNTGYVGTIAGNTMTLKCQNYAGNAPAVPQPTPNSAKSGSAG